MPKHEKENYVKWLEGTKGHGGTDGSPYGLDITVIPRLRREYKYLSGVERVEYIYLSDNEVFKMKNDKPIVPGENLSWLMAIVRMTREYRYTKFMEIDYTEKIAGFFVNLIKSICMLNEQIKDVLDPESIKKLADKGFNLLSAGENQ